MFRHLQLFEETDDPCEDVGGGSVDNDTTVNLAVSPVSLIEYSA